MTQAQTWVRRLKESDPSVCTEVFDAMYGPMLRYATWITQDEEAAYDILQDVFFNLWQGRQRLNPDLPLKALLFKMTRNRALNHQRKKQHQQTRLSAMQEIVPDQEPHPDNSLEAKMLGTRIHQWISELPPRQREAPDPERSRSAEMATARSLLQGFLSPSIGNSRTITCF